MKKHIPFGPTLIATGFGSGFWPWGPGTAGAALATLMWLGLSCATPSWLMTISSSLMTAPSSLMTTSSLLAMVTVLLVVVFTAAGTWATARVQPWLGDDPKQVVVDEMVGVWIPLIVCPAGSVGYAVLAFVLFRFFDIFKPLGIRALDRRRGAFWVMADDILAGIYSLIVICVVRWLA